MNAQLLNPFQITHPTAVQTSFFSYASFARFDPSGRYLAAGRYDGSTVIWDVELKAPVRWFDGHVKASTSVDWSRNSRYLLTASRDWNVIVWDLVAEWEPPQRKTTIRFDAPVVSASFHPRNSNIVLALMGSGEAYIADLRKGHRSREELIEPLGEEVDADDDRRTGMTAAKFDPTGKLIYVGTTSGSILVFNTRTKTMIARHKVPGAMVFKGFEFTKSGRKLVANSSDRSLRQFNLPTYPPTADGTFVESDLEPSHKFSDPINKTAWHAMSYSPDGEWLAGADPSGHKVYIWDMANDGRLSSALDGGREPLTYLHWHPSKSCMASTTKQGNILLWHHPIPERWGAFAGGFEEVDENVEYEEREDEFDVEDETQVLERKRREEEQEVDISTMPEDADKKFRTIHRVGEEAHDDDFAWADDEPDDDVGGWRLKVVISQDQGF